MKHLFIINPNCGKGISYERCANGIVEAMEEMGITDYDDLASFLFLFRMRQKGKHRDYGSSVIA